MVMRCVNAELERGLVGALIDPCANERNLIGSERLGSRSPATKSTAAARTKSAAAASAYSSAALAATWAARSTGTATKAAARPPLWATGSAAKIRLWDDRIQAGCDI